MGLRIRKHTGKKRDTLVLRQIFRKRRLALRRFDVNSGIFIQNLSTAVIYLKNILMAESLRAREGG